MSAKSVLVILVHEEWLSHPAIVALQEKGHIIRPVGKFPTIDLLLHPAAHNWSEDLFGRKGLLDIVLKQAQKRAKARKI